MANLLSSVQINTTIAASPKLLNKLSNMNCFHINDQNSPKFTENLAERFNTKLRLQSLVDTCIEEYLLMDTKHLDSIQNTLRDLNSDIEHLQYRLEQLQILHFIISNLDPKPESILGTIPKAFSYKFEQILFTFGIRPRFHEFNAEMIFIVDDSSPKINKLCHLLKAKCISNKPVDLYILNEQINQVQQLINTKNELISNELGYHDTTLRKWLFSTNSDINYFYLLNKCDFHQNLLSIQGWVPSDSLDLLKAFIDECEDTTISLVMIDNPPTWLDYERDSVIFHFSKFCHNMVGIPNTNEIDICNVFIVFPVLFGLLIGDIGHGTLILVAAMNLIFVGRILGYPLFLMALFTIYSGFIYNQFFGVALQLFKSPFDENKSIYYFGLDYHYHDNFDFVFYFKIKLLYIMTFMMILLGLIIKFINIHKEFKLMRLMNNLPQFLIYMTWFGYPIALMILEWMQYKLTVYNCLYELVFHPFTKKSKYPHQTEIEIGLLIIATTCLLWLFLANPITLYFKQRIYNQQGYIPLHFIRIRPFHLIMQTNLVEISSFIYYLWAGMQSFIRLFAFSLAHGFIANIIWDTKETSMTFWIIGTLYFTFGHAIVAVGIAMHGFIVFKNQFYKGNGIKWTPVEI